MSMNVDADAIMAALSPPFTIYAALCEIGYMV
jgi:hypothetical protein